MPPSFKFYLLLGSLAYLYVDGNLWLPIASVVSLEEPKVNPMDDFRLCRIIPYPVLGESWVDLDSHNGIKVDYQCAGKEYSQFAANLENLVLEESQLQSKQSWGRRASIAPVTKRNCTSLLVMGNSHTRQLVQALLCQYKEHVIDVKPLSQPGTFQARLTNNVTIFAVCNSPVITSKTWPRILENTIIKQPLSSIDAIVLGHFNTVEESSNTNHMKMMLQYHKNFPKAPKVDDIARLFQGTVIWTGMFSHRNMPHHSNAVEMIQNLKSNRSRSNLHSVYARQYIERLPSPHDECSTDNHQVGTCVTDLNDKRYREGHRCMGARGGNPDLIAWDVIEILHKALAF